MRIFDVSVPISARMPTYPGDPRVNIRPWLSLDKGDPANVSLIDFGAHTGTHVDAPAHFIRGGAKMEFMNLETLMGEVHVIEIPDDVIEITESHIENNVRKGATRVLFKTRNSAFWSEETGKFRTDYTYVSAGAARQLVARGIRLVGIDYLSVEQFQSQTFATHEALLSSGVVIIEGLDLRQVKAGVYELICLPLKIAGGSGDGAPARVVLRTLD
ncbi:MAG: cyclase family protein [Acidobacteriota bacterium]|nr:cyclase family protein [Acidobacteriota bacterium]